MEVTRGNAEGSPGSWLWDLVSKARLVVILPYVTRITDRIHEGLVLHFKASVHLHKQARPHQSACNEA